MSQKIKDALEKLKASGERLKMGAEALKNAAVILLKSNEVLSQASDRLSRVAEKLDQIDANIKKMEHPSIELEKWTVFLVKATSNKKDTVTIVDRTSGKRYTGLSFDSNVAAFGEGKTTPEVSQMDRAIIAQALNEIRPNVAKGLSN